MKHHILLLALGLCGLPGYAQNTLTINASIKGLAAGRAIYYKKVAAYAWDSVKAQADGFRIVMDVPEGDEIILAFKGEMTFEAGINLYVEKGVLNITGNGPLFRDVRYSGSPFAEEADAYYQYMHHLRLIDSLDEVVRESEQALADNDTAFYNSSIKDFFRLNGIGRVFTKEWVLEHPSSPFSLFLVTWELYDLPDQEKQRLIDRLSPSAMNNGLGKTVAEANRIEKLKEVGNLAMDFTQNDTSGKPVSLHDYRGKYVFIDFWASWCHWCRAENPFILAAFNKYKGRNFVVLGVSIDDKRDKWTEAIREDGVPWEELSDLKGGYNAVARMYNVGPIPVNFLLDPEGRIIARDLRGEALEKELEKVIK